ncbi:MAG: DUF4082 domain-containing protein [Lewinellaceae bacterium]|nr:DUF4082 domain-containing protein [Lewinellaceae bacterium]
MKLTLRFSISFFLAAIAFLPVLSAQNEIVTENALTGNPAAEWDITGAGDLSIQGFATDLSVNKGTTVDFKINVDGAVSYTIKIYRLGYYQGNGARLIADLGSFAGIEQPDPVEDLATGLVDCGNWALSASWAVPANAVSGLYIAKLTRSDNNGASHIAFVVRDDSGNSDLLFKTSDATWQAYNGYGGNSLYTGSVNGYPGGHAVKVSYNRPFLTRDGGAGSGSSEDWLFNSEYPMIRWLERNGYDVSYATDIDMDRFPAPYTTAEHKVLLSVGHDEYWSADERAKFEGSRNNGVHLAFLSGNEIYWKTRWENSIDGNNTPHRTLVCYKEGTLGENQCGTKCDPLPNVWTGLWRDGCAYTPPADGCNPENALSGQISWDGSVGPIKVPDTYKNLRFWRNTPNVSTLGAGQTWTLPDETLGYEWDWEQYAASYPNGRILMSSTVQNSRTHKLSLYRHSSGALVFGAGTVQWAWGLDANHDRGTNNQVSIDMQQATVNLLADMDVQAGSLQMDLNPATASADVQPPTSVITSPLDAATLPVGGGVVISGTASELGGGIVAGVEVSLDGGTTWQVATGTTNWTYNWVPAANGSVVILSRAFDDSGNIEAAGTPPAANAITVTIDGTVTCPCTVFQPINTPANPNGNDGQGIVLGMRFQSTQAGFITALRYYKGANFTGTRTGHLWNSAGLELASITFSGETASGWQETSLSPVAINANETYVVGYHSPAGDYGYSDNYFTAPVINGPLTAPADNAPTAPNGLYVYSGTPAFPTQTYQASNYWVDVVFETSVGPDMTPPVVLATAPVANASGVSTTANITGTFNEDLNPATVSGATFELRDPGNNLVPATVSYNAGTRMAILDPSATLDNSTVYTATLFGGVSGIADLAGNTLVSDYVWSFTTAAPPPPPPTEGPGGPILVVSAAANPFSRYPVELLRAEGLNEFFAADITAVTATLLNDYDVVLLGEMTLSPTEVTMFSDWVDAGGTLIVLRPEKTNNDLLNLLGLNSVAGTLSEGYVLVNNASGPGVGIVGETIQFHGTADQYALNGASSLATLYSDAVTATSYPAVTQRVVGANNGKAVAFTYDLARSIVYTRQGNPAWSGQNRDGSVTDGVTRSNDLFYGNDPGDPQPDWVNLNKAAIPQADEQQRLLTNIILQGALHRKPLPRFWFLPFDYKAAVVMTGDDHGVGLTADFFQDFIDSSGVHNTPTDVANWTAIRGSSYVYTTTPIPNATNFQSQGFEIALHVNTDCADWTPATLPGFYTNQLATFAASFPGINAPATHRTHCIAWSDWATQPQVEFDNGIRLDVNFYYWPESWIQNRPGMFTGSGLPMRFADLDGTLIDCYQVTTQMTDESGQTYPLHHMQLIDNATGPAGYYGVFCANFHTDRQSSRALAGGLIGYAKTKNVPVISSKQMLDWLDGRNGSSFSNITWDGNDLDFTVSVGTGALNMRGMLQVNSANDQLIGLTRDGNPVAYSTETIKGMEYAFFPATAGNYVATYGVDNVPPVITNIVATPNNNGTATITWDTDEAADSQVDYDIVADPLSLNTSDPALVSSHSVLLTGLAPNTTYYFRVTSTDGSANSATEPNPPAAALSFTMPTGFCAQDQTVADFGLGTVDGNTLVALEGDGSVVLTPFLSEEFSGNSIPAGWTEGLFNPGSTTVSGGSVTVNGTHIYSNNSVVPGTSLEFVATYNSAAFQNIGFSDDQPFNNAPWVVIGQGASPDGNLYARASDGSSINLGANLLGSAHRYRIKWNANSFEFFVDNNPVPAATINLTVATNMYIQISDVQNFDGTLSVDWLRATPYAVSGSYTSRVFDQGVPNGWGIANWTATLPVNTSLSMFARTGNTLVPDGTWTAFLPLTNGNPIGGNNQYLQYRADLATTDNLYTPVLDAISIECGSGPDMTPPVITNVQAVSAPDGLSATITWDTDEDANSLVEYGTSPGMLDQSVSGAAFEMAHSLVLLGLTPGVTYYYRVSSTDVSNNAASEPVSPGTLDFVTLIPPPPPCFADGSAADFAQGSFAGTYLSLIDDGVILKPTAASEFSAMPPTNEWASFPWTGGTSTVSGGILTVDGARFNSEPATPGFSPGATLEFVATFGADAFQAIGFGGGSDATGSGGIFNGENDWAMFSTFNVSGQLYARTKNGASEVNISLGASYIGASHRYRIEWNTNDIAFYIDGTLVHTETANITQAMRPAISDLTNGGSVTLVDWIHTTPYAASGTFTSRAFDAGNVKDWAEVSWTADEPAGTTLTLYQRQGSTPVPDGTWTAFTQIPGNGANIGGTSRYIQYRADFTTSNTAVTAVLQEVAFNCSECTNPAATLTNNSAANTICSGTDVIFTAEPAGALDYEFFVNGGSVQTGSSNTYTTNALTDGAEVYVVVTDEDACNTSSSNFMQTTLLDFNEGTSGVCSLWEVGDGEVTLAPTEGALFDGASLPAGWASTMWTAGGASTLSGGQVMVDGAFLATVAAYPAGRAIEFVATFGSESFEHVGFGVDVNNDPNWAMFSTHNVTGQLYARTNNGTAANVLIPGSFIGTPHRYRIEWNINSVLFYVDGVLVHTENVTISANMRPLISDYNNTGTAVSVDWLRMTDYSSPCTYDSKVFDAGSTANWGNISWLGDEPGNTSISMSVRTGDTPTPDGTWTSFMPVGNGASIGVSARYAQYRAELQTTDPTQTPALEQINLAYTSAVSYMSTSGTETITVNITPTADAPGDVTACDSYTLPVLTVGNYFTGSGGTGTALNAGAAITSTQTLYVYAETGTYENSSTTPKQMPMTAAVTYSQRARVALARRWMQVTRSRARKNVYAETGAQLENS